MWFQHLIKLFQFTNADNGYGFNDFVKGTAQAFAGEAGVAFIGYHREGVSIARYCKIISHQRQPTF